MSKLFFCEDFLLEDHRNNVPDCPFCRGMELEEEANRLQAKLSLYTSWQPSDPGTKKAMECLHAHADDCECRRRLATALTAAMVRLEEAEKKIEDRTYWTKKLWDTEQFKRAEAAESQVAALEKEREDRL
jgi:hypothetical protein